MIGVRKEKGKRGNFDWCKKGKRGKGEKGKYNVGKIDYYSEEGLSYKSEIEIPVYYHRNIVGIHKLDFLIQDQLVLELKTVGEIHKEHYAQIRSYLKAAHKDIGLLINFAAFQLDTRTVEIKKRIISFPLFPLSPFSFLTPINLF